MRGGLACSLIRSVYENRTMTHTPSRQLILASTSVYRRQLLERLRVPFAVISPEVDESALVGELPEPLARRLALAKAQAVAVQHPDAVVIAPMRGQ